MRGRQLAALAGLLVLAGCAGRDFVRPLPAELTLGRTTEAEVRRQLGEPFREGTVVSNGETLKTLGYAYASAAASLAGGLIPSRVQGFYFWREVLVGHEFTSSFPEDSTDFDVAEAEAIRQGETTEAEVVARLGLPHGAWIHPLVAGPEDRGLVYLHWRLRGGILNPVFYQQQLVVTVGADGVVKAVELTTEGER